MYVLIVSLDSKALMLKSPCCHESAGAFDLMLKQPGLFPQFLKVSIFVRTFDKKTSPCVM